jgi:phosphoglycolate phosphatase
MTQSLPSFAAFDDILNQTRHLLLDFDGPVCTLFAGTSTAPVADRLRKVLTQQGAELPQAIQETPTGSASCLSPHPSARPSRHVSSPN